LQNIDQLAIHFTMDGNMIHSESEDAKRQMLLHGEEDGTRQFQTIQTIRDFYLYGLGEHIG